MKRNSSGEFTEAPESLFDSESGREAANRRWEGHTPNRDILPFMVFQPYFFDSVSTGPGVYFIQASSGGLTKIGRAINLQRRIYEIQAMSPVDLEVRAVVETVDPNALEKVLHKLNNSKRVRGEWFDLDDEDIPQA